MKGSALFTATLIALAPLSANAQQPSANRLLAAKMKTALAKVIKKESTFAGSVKTTGMDLKTTLPCQTTSYAYDNGTWQKESTTKTEYNSKGYATATETTTDVGRTRTENTYDDLLEGMMTKAVAYSWDAASGTWTNPTVVYSVELTRDDKNRVTKQTIYALDEDTKELAKISEEEFGYSLVTGKLNKISTTVEDEDDNGNPVSVTLNVNILKWHKYNENKLFSFTMDDIGGGLIGNTENQIESGTLSTTISNIPLTGTIKGEYTDSKSTLTVDLMSIISIVMTNEQMDKYGSNLTKVSMYTGDKETMSQTVLQAFNEFGDCTRIETTETDATETLGITDVSTELPEKTVTTMDYEYLETTSKPANDFTSSDYGFIKKSMVVNNYDSTTEQYVPVQKVTYDEYIDYVSGTTGIDRANNAASTQNKAFYNLDGTKVDNIPTNGGKGVYIVKEGSKTYKIVR